MNIYQSNFQNSLTQFHPSASRQARSDQRTVISSLSRKCVALNNAAKSYLRIVLLSIFTLSVFSCSTKEKKNTISKTDQDTVPATNEYRGLYFPGKEGSSGMMKICLDAKNTISYPVNDETNSLDSLYKKTIPGAYPYQTLFLDVNASIEASGAQDPPYTIIVKKVLKVESKNFKNSCIPFDYWCKGNEPFWQVEISEKEHLIDFFDPMIPKYYHFQFEQSANKNGEDIYTSKNETDKIEIRIKKENCSDGMSEIKYNYSTKVKLNNKSYSGCAIKFGEDPK